MTSWLNGSITWAVKAPNQRESFCLDFIASFLESIQVIDVSFDWLSRCSENDAIYHILEVYKNFVACSKCQPSLELLPDCIEGNQSQSVVKIFTFVIEIHKFLKGWYDRFTSRSLNYDQILSYRQNIKRMQKLSTYLNAEYLVYPDRSVKETKVKFEDTFKKLNSFLLKPVRGDGQDKM